jgi:hypothetical protein
MNKRMAKMMTITTTTISITVLIDTIHALHNIAKLHLRGVLSIAPLVKGRQ